jgi:hypothetical protein
MEYQVRKAEAIEFFIRVEEDEKSGGTRYTLRRSDSPVWTEHARGEEVISAVDDRNGVRLTRKLKNINYAEFTELLILLTFIKSFDKNIACDYSIEKVENLASI